MGASTLSRYQSNYMGCQNLAAYLKDNLVYYPDSGELYWTKPKGKRDLKKPVGVLHSSGYLIFSAGFDNKSYSLRVHRVCWFLHTGSWPKKFLDHINGDGTDNRIRNLREATYLENNQNMSISKKNTSGYKGVSWCGERGKWTARIKDGSGKYCYLGRFGCKTAAAIAYDRASLEYHGEFGNRNFP